MNRRQRIATSIAALALAFGGGALTASAASPNDSSCKAGITTTDGWSATELQKYDACRFDLIDSQLAALKPGSTPTPTPSPSASPTPSATPTKSPSPTPTPTSVSPTPTPTSTVVPAGVCPTGQAPSAYQQYFTANGSGSVDGVYDGSAEQWGVNGYSYAATEGFCSHDSWFADIKTDNSKGDGAVKSYPSIRRIYHDWSTSDFSKDPRLSSFSQLTVDVAQTDPASCSGCIYEDAFDIWANGIGGSNNTELMIWTSNVGQTPYGSKVASGIVVDGRTWDLYSGNSNHYVAYVPTGGARISSGTFDIKAFFADLVARGRVASSAYDAQGGKTDPFLGQISYGVEPVSTGGVTKHWDFTRFSVNDGGKTVPTKKAAPATTRRVR